MNRKVKLLTLFGFLCSGFAFGQLGEKKEVFTHADTLRGAYGPERDWWDVLKYNLDVKFNPEDSTVDGEILIQFKVLKKGKMMQIDLQEPLKIKGIEFSADNRTEFDTSFNNHRYWKRDGNAYFIETPKLKVNSIDSIHIWYRGKPKVAVNPPWDGGVIWKKDKNNNPWISVACQGLGASVWYPCKDHQSDEPDSGATISISVPDSLVAVSNGRNSMTMSGYNINNYTWTVKSPINNYNIVPYIGKYVHFNQIYKGLNGNLDMDYWVLDYNLEKAKKQFTDAPRMMKAFEYWFGPYPFYEDGYKLVDAPHLGMEHQSAIAYGNGYQNGYYGQDLSGSGWGMKWDFIIVHESGHEWFGNNITTKDIADMWVHEGFTNYSEALFTEYYYGKQAGDAYVRGLRKNIENKTPIISPYNVNTEGSIDMYYKGSNLLHTIRQIINNDSLFRKILWGLNKTFYHQTVTTHQIEMYINRQSKIDFSKVFDQYLRTIQVPTLEYTIAGYKLKYRYTTCIKDFTMPLKINFKGARWIHPTEAWQTLDVYPEGDAKFSVDPNFYINTKKVD